MTIFPYLINNFPVFDKLINMKNKFFLGLLSLLVLLASCNLKATVTIKKDASGTADATITVDKMLLDFVYDLQSTMAAEPVERGAMITEEMVREGLEKSQTVKLTSFNTADQTDTQLSVGFSDINSVIEEAQTGVREKGTISRDDLENIVNFTNTTGKYKFVFFLDRSNFAKLVSILPEEATPLVTMFGPSLDENNPVTREDYYEFLNEAFSAYETPDRIRTMVDNASMTLRVRTDGSIISQRGGRIENNNTVVFEIPLMDFILLEKPIDLEVVFN